GGCGRTRHMHLAAIALAAAAWQPLPAVPPAGYSTVEGVREGRRMARAPIAGSDRAAVWTGREMIVPAGAAYDPEGNRWRTISPAPFRARAAVWTGRRILILGARV